LEVAAEVGQAALQISGRIALLRVLVAQKELREKRNLSIRTIVRETGASRSAVQMLLANTMKQVPLDDLAKLCSWLPAEAGDILKFEEVPEA
jgi:DNA-binding Xre family transcriptional regulator